MNKSNKASQKPASGHMSPTEFMAMLSGSGTGKRVKPDVSTVQRFVEMVEAPPQSQISDFDPEGADDVFCIRALGYVTMVGVEGLIYDELLNAFDEHLIEPAILESWVQHRRNDRLGRFFTKLAQRNEAGRIVRFQESAAAELPIEVGLAGAREIFAAPIWSDCDFYGGAKWAAIVDAYESFMKAFKSVNTSTGAADIAGLAGAIRRLWEMPHNTGTLGEKLLRWIRKQSAAQSVKIWQMPEPTAG